MINNFKPSSKSSIVSQLFFSYLIEQMENLEFQHLNIFFMIPKLKIKTRKIIFGMRY